MALPTVSGFTLYPIIYSKQATHVLYGKAHSTTKSASPTPAMDVLSKDRTLFLVNVPPDATERELIIFFKHHGMIEKVVFDQKAAEEEALRTLNALEQDSEGSGDEEVSDEDNEDNGGQKRKKNGKEVVKSPSIEYIPSTPIRHLRNSGRTAFVVFLDASSLAAALATPQRPRPWIKSDEPHGLNHYKTLYSASRPPLDAVRAYAESVIAAFDYDEAQKKRASQYKKGEAIVDEDGFTLVTHGGAYGQSVGGGVGVATKRFQETGEASESAKARKKKRKADESKNRFYGFQRHEKKRQELITLKRKWAEDKEKVQKLKESKRYKPY